MKFHPLLASQIETCLRTEAIPETMRDLFQQINQTYYACKGVPQFMQLEGSSDANQLLASLEQQHDAYMESLKRIQLVLRNEQSLLNTSLEQDLNLLEEQLQKTKEVKLQLIQANIKAELASKAKTDFLSVMSHEIRTPLNAIIGMAHVMMSEERSPSQLENLRALNISAENLLSLINDILDFSKIEEGKIELSERAIDLKELVNNIKMANRIRAEERGNALKVFLDTDIPSSIMADDVRLSQILNNLVSNAIKFTNNGTITIEVRVIGTTADSLEIQFSVTDTGIGIEKEKQSVIFDHFSQANTDITREFGGSGLGLAIIRRLLHLMKSEVFVESELGRGSRFYFSVAFKKGVADTVVASPAHHRASTDLKGVSVLLVEDVEFNVMVAEKMLTNWNAKVEVAENELNAVGKARDGKYDIILMDLQMPVLDGYSATKHIREFNPEIPIIALTASASSDVQERTKEVGMNGYVSKPFKPTDLFDTISRHTAKAV